LIVFNDEQLTKHFLLHAQAHQRSFFPDEWQLGLIKQIDHSVRILSEDDCHLMSDLSPNIILERQQALSPYKKALFAKEHKGALSWTLALYGTPAMAHEAGLSIDAYWEQIIQACSLDLADPIAVWRRTQAAVTKIKHTLDAMRIERLHMIGEDCDIHIGLGKDRCWLG
jgi:aminopeptidase